MWKTVLVHAAPESVPGAQNANAYAVSLAADQKAELLAVAYAFRQPAPFGLRTGVDRSAADSHEAAVRQAAEASIGSVARLCERQAVELEDRIESCLAVDAPSTFAQYARVADVTVIGSGHDEAGDSRELIEAALFQSGRPVILVPEAGVDAFAAKTIAIAWNDTPQSARALADALPLIVRAKETHIVMVTDDDRLDAAMPAIEVAKYLARHGAKAVVDEVQANGQSVRDAIVDRAVAAGADLLVMGAYGHSRLREQILGGATRDMIAGAPLPVLMSH